MPRVRPIRGGTAAISSSRWTRPTTSTASAGIPYYEDSNPECTDFQYSEDGTNWFSLTNEISFVPKLTDDGWKIFRFKKTVKARYIRVYVGRVTGYTSMNEAEIFAPAN